MKWTSFFIPTTKETPAEATVPSHRLMLRAGLIRQVVAGAYTYLPLGYLTLRKIEQIVREEMNAAGAIELHMPAMHPIEWWQQTGRVESMGEVLVGLRSISPDDWRSRTVLGPTHEEVITEIAKAYINSYKQLPINLYQIQTKFRGEARPKSGVLRTREFLMKDAYSFHITKEGPGGLDEGYRRMYDAYCAIFSRCGLPYIVVEAESGPIGGDASHEFMVPTDAGEDWLVQAEDGSYAANLERAEVAPLPDLHDGTNAPLREVHTPGHGTIEEVSGFLGCEPRKLIKTIVYEANGQALVALVRGDHEVNEAKLCRAAKVPSVKAADAELIRKVTGAEVGFAGPAGLRPYVASPSPFKGEGRGEGPSPSPFKGEGCGEGLGVRVIADQAVTVMHDAVTGANKTDFHITGVNPGRDFQIKEWADIRKAVEGDRAPNGSPLIFKKCIEVGHVFKLGTKYSVAMEATCLDAEGKTRPFIMGCYGIGLNRIMAAAIEAMHDEQGICWPMSIAPFQVVICVLDTRDATLVSLAQRLHDEMQAAGIEVLLDDRDVRAGVKFNDADLIGFPLRINVGKRGLDQGIVEIRKRRTGETLKLAPDRVTTAVSQLIQATICNERT